MSAQLYWWKQSNLNSYKLSALKRLIISTWQILWFELLKKKSAWLYWWRQSEQRISIIPVLCMYRYTYMSHSESFTIFFANFSSVMLIAHACAIKPKAHLVMFKWATSEKVKRSAIGGETKRPRSNFAPEIVLFAQFCCFLAVYYGNIQSCTRNNPFTLGSPSMAAFWYMYMYMIVPGIWKCLKHAHTVTGYCISNCA